MIPFELNQHKNFHKIVCIVEEERSKQHCSRLFVLCFCGFVFFCAYGPCFVMQY